MAEYKRQVAEDEYGNRVLLMDDGTVTWNLGRSVGTGSAKALKKGGLWGAPTTPQEKFDQLKVALAKATERDSQRPVQRSSPAPAYSPPPAPSTPSFSPQVEDFRDVIGNVDFTDPFDSRFQNVGFVDPFDSRYQPVTFGGGSQGVDFNTMGQAMPTLDWQEPQGGGMGAPMQQAPPQPGGKGGGRGPAMQAARQGNNKGGGPGLLARALSQVDPAMLQQGVRLLAGGGGAPPMQQAPPQPGGKGAPMPAARQGGKGGGGKGGPVAQPMPYGGPIGQLQG